MRIDVDIAIGEVERHILASKYKMRGFRDGMVPVDVLLKQIGPEALLGTWADEALHKSNTNAIEQPEMCSAEIECNIISFSIETWTSPVIDRGDYIGISVEEIRAVPDEEVEAEVWRLRAESSDWQQTDQPADFDSYVTINHVGKIDGKVFGSGRRTIRLGDEDLLDGFSDSLVGVVSGDKRLIPVAFPARYPEPRIAGKEAVFEVDVERVSLEVPATVDKIVELKQVDSIEALYESIHRSITNDLQNRLDEKLLDSIAERASLEVPSELVEERLEAITNRASNSELDLESYMQTLGKDRDELRSEIRESTRREMVLAAIIRAEDLSPTDTEIAQIAMEETGEQSLSVALYRLAVAEELANFRAETSKRKALDFIKEHAG